MNVESKPTQNQRIIEYITEFGSITQLDALRDLGVMRLASRISDLRRNGYEIESDIVGVKNRYGETCRIKRYRFSEREC
ncbi:MAG: helix-turn-helix domain-containing protein [Eubacteriales bacterium]